jgi:hypothetical protein
MTRSSFTAERTAAGLQYVIPGTERPAPPKRPARPVYGSEGDQLVIPGAEPIGTRALLERRAARPLRPARAQKSLAGTALFGRG